jgi:xylulokinase
MKEPLMANSRGTAMLALLALGHLDVNAAAEAVEVNKTFEPNPANRSLYAELFSVYVDIYNKNKPIFARLNH